MPHPVLRRAVLRGGSRLNPESKFRFKTLDFYFEPKIVTFEPHRMLIWSAKGPDGTSGSHAWYIEPTPRGCCVITEGSKDDDPRSGARAFRQDLQHNARGTYFTVQKALPHLNDGASIILVASAGKNKGFPGRSTYSATKAALRSFARTWTSELKDRKIRTTC